MILEAHMLLHLKKYFLNWFMTAPQCHKTSSYNKMIDSASHKHSTL